MEIAMKKAGSVNHSSKGVLKILFKEILQQISPEDAESLTEMYRQGREIGFRIRQNSRGIGYKTAFQPFVSKERIQKLHSESGDCKFFVN
jgi:hypothetical protein